LTSYPAAEYSSASECRARQLCSGSLLGSM
jgi:hypothetical protein